MSTVQEAAARAANELRAVLTMPHSPEFRVNALIGARVAVARAIADSGLDPATTPGARRRFHATSPGYDARMAAYRSLPNTYGELLTVLDALAAQPVAA